MDEIIENCSKDEKTSILLKITEELIRNSKTEQVRELERRLALLNIIKDLENEQKNKSKNFKVKIPKTNQDSFKRFNQQISYLPQRKPQYAIKKPEIETQEPLPVFNLNTEEKISIPPKQENFQMQRFNPPTRTQNNQEIPKLIIPDVNLPERFQYLKPGLTQETIDLGKLNPLIKDPQVREIQCDGPDKEIIVKTPMLKRTSIVLNQEEIKDVFYEFSRIAKIPAKENIVKIAAANLILNGINSDVIEPKFIIRKITPQSYMGRY